MYREKILPQLGRWIMPVVETPAGKIIQDGSAILDHFEASNLPRFSILPESPILRAVSHLFELFGNEGLVRPAMHYRWDFEELNGDFLRGMVESSLFRSDRPGEVYERFSATAHEVMASWGVTSETHEPIETSYKDFLKRFNAHLSEVPFLLGGRPTVGDFGLFNPLYGHLGRDVAPDLLMKQTAPRVN